MDLDRLYHLMILLSLIGFGMVILGLVGEHLGWWNDIGEVVISFGTLIGVLTALIALIMGSTRGQVRRVADAALENNGKLDAANGKLDTVNGKLDTVNGKLDTVNGKLDTTNVRLGTIDGKLDKLEDLDKLDVVQAKLDDQTGVMTRQVHILEQIRDGLAG